MRRSRCWPSTSSPGRSSRRCSRVTALPRTTRSVKRARGACCRFSTSQHLEKETRGALKRFYGSVRVRAAGVDRRLRPSRRSSSSSTTSFSATPFPEDDRAPGHRLHPGRGCRFHPAFGRRSCCRSEFGQTVGSEGVHIIDPFVGTGTFITRLLQSGLIKPEQLAHKYRA